MRSLKKLLFFAAGTILSIMMPAQNLPPLKPAPQIKQGSLRCGVKYYLVTDASAKGYADMAIVRRDEVPSEQTRSQLRSLNGFNVPPYEFLGRHGIGCREQGYFTDEEGSTVFHFDDVPVSDPSVLDSALLLSFSLVTASKADQAIIVSGDISVPEVTKKMEIFSMMVPQMYPSTKVVNYVWEPTVCPAVMFTRTGPGERAEIKVTYTSPRTPPEYMNTAQPLIMDIFFREFSEILVHRLESNLRNSEVPFSSISTDYTPSSATSYDEKFSVSVVAPTEYANQVMETISYTYASLEAFGAVQAEFNDAKKVLSSGMANLAVSPPGNRAWTDLCSRAFLYGAWLTPFSEEEALFSRKNVKDSVELRHFNTIASALLDQSSNIMIDYRARLDSLDDNQVIFDYNLAYIVGSKTRHEYDYAWSRGDTLALAARYPKVKLKTEKTEPVSGGWMWTFSNGMKVAFKRVPGAKMFDFCLLLNGGYSLIPSLKEGEGGYYSDMPKLFGTAGMDAEVFWNTLKANGIEIEPSVTVSDMKLRGSAPKERLNLLLKALIAYGDSREMDTAAFSNYLSRRRMSFRLGDSEQDRLGRTLDSLLCPGYVYTPYISESALSEDLQSKAAKYLNDRFVSVDDGVLVISGDFDEPTLKKILCRYMGGFHTSRYAQARRPVQYQAISGTSVSTVEGDPKGIYMLLSTEYPLTSLNYLCSDIVAERLRVAAVGAAAPYGLSVSVSRDYASYPQERLSYMIACTPADPSGLPEGIGGSVMDALPSIRKAISDCAAKDISASDLARYKGLVTGRTGALLGTTATITDAVTLRYSRGKDLISHYNENINQINAAKIKEMSTAAVTNGRVEYIVK